MICLARDFSGDARPILDATDFACRAAGALALILATDRWGYNQWYWIAGVVVIALLVAASLILSFNGLGRKTWLACGLGIWVPAIGVMLFFLFTHMQQHGGALACGAGFMVSCASTSLKTGSAKSTGPCTMVESATVTNI